MGLSNENVPALQPPGELLIKGADTLKVGLMSHESHFLVAGLLRGRKMRGRWWGKSTALPASSLLGLVQLSRAAALTERSAFGGWGLCGSANPGPSSRPLDPRPH